MFSNYIKLAFRNLKKNKIISLINILGLAIGIGYATLIILWVHDEINFDDFHQNKESIYRILLQRKGFDEISAETPGKLAPAVKKHFPEIKYAARVMQNLKSPFKYEKKSFYETTAYCVDSDFFKMFNFPIIKGDFTNPIEAPKNIIISESIAKKYFGNENPIGKSLIWNNWRSYKVSSVMKDFPDNSSFNIDIIESHQMTAKFWENGYNWTNQIHETYIQTKAKLSKSEAIKLEKKIEKFYNKEAGFTHRYYYVHLQPFSEIHLNAEISWNYVRVTDNKYVSVFSLIAIGILLIACINFVNISSAVSINRAREIGVRKVIGAGRKKIIQQFLVEFLFMTVIVSVISFLITSLSLPYFNQFTEKSLTINLEFLFFFFAVTVITVLLAGIYPAVILSGFIPSEVLKNKLKIKRKSFSWQTALVIFQFTVSIFLIVCTLTVNNQIEFIRNKNLGFDKENIIYIPAKGDLIKQFNSFENTLKSESGITDLSIQECVPTTTIKGSWINWEGQLNQDIVVRTTEVKENYFDLMNIQIIKGIGFSEIRSDNKDYKFVLNEEALKTTGIKLPLNKIIDIGGRRGEIIGIVKNSYFRSLHHKVEPMVFIPLKDYNSIDLFGVILIKYDGNYTSEVINKINQLWNKYNSELPFEFHFLDDTIQHQYDEEQKLQTVFSMFSLLAIGISVLGLLGMAILTIDQNIKEIGIKKVLGASVTKLTSEITTDFVKWIILANIFAWPLAYFAMKVWLSNFEYKINTGIDTYLIAALLAFAVSGITVGIKAFKTANANPVKSLKYE